MILEQSQWGTIQEKSVTLYMISDPKTKFVVKIIDFGATLVRVQIPDKSGRVDDIIFGQNEPDLYSKKGYFGATIGRIANRIKDAHFNLDGREYVLNKNNNNLHNLHGGTVGFSRKFWECKKSIVTDTDAELEFEYCSPDGEEGFPGKLIVTLRYKITPLTIEWEYTGTTDSPTICNLTNHSFWNLDGPETLIDNLELTLNASLYQIADDNACPTGDIGATADTPLDFHESKFFHQVWKEYGDIDNSFLLDGYTSKSNDKELFLAASLYSPTTGRKMEIFTTESCIQLYTGFKMDILTAFGGKPCKKRNALCLETQRVVNAIQYSQYANQVILRPNQRYYHKTIHKFSIN